MLKPDTGTTVIITCNWNNCYLHCAKLQAEMNWIYRCTTKSALLGYFTKITELEMSAVASLGLAHVTRSGNWWCHPIFSFNKLTIFSHRLWRVMTLFSCRLLTIPSSHVVYPLFFLNPATKKINFSRVSPPPLERVTRGGPPPPSDATEWTFEQRPFQVKAQSEETDLSDDGRLFQTRGLRLDHYIINCGIKSLEVWRLIICLVQDTSAPVC